MLKRLHGVFSLPVLSCALLAALLLPGSAVSLSVTLVNADAAGNQVSRFDVDGNSLDAHDGTLALFGGTYYLYGTRYGCGYEYQRNSRFCGFKVYSSPDLVHWTDRGFAVPARECAYCFRPHVLYNASTATYVMWTDAGGAYHVFTSSTPTGPFIQKPNPTLAVGGAVDEALYQDDDGTGWLIHNTTLVASGLTADMVVEKLTPDYLNTTGEFVRLGLGDVEAFAVFKRDGTYHALMSDPSCAYCAGATGEMTSKSMLGPWKGAWYDSSGVHQSGRKQPRWRARIVNPDNCGGQPLQTLSLDREDGTKAFYFVSDRWNNRAPNESLANLYIGPLAFAADGTLQSFTCVDSFTVSLKVGSAGAYKVPQQFDQGSGFDGFRHYCDIGGRVQRRQGFTPSRTGSLVTASVTTFQGGYPNEPLLVDVMDADGGVLHTTTVAASGLSWAPQVVTLKPGIPVVAGRKYALRLRSSTTAGCYGMEYNDYDPYAGGWESYSADAGIGFTPEPARDIKFTTAVASPAATGWMVRLAADQALTVPEGMKGFELYSLRGEMIWRAEGLRPGARLGLPQGISLGALRFRWVD